MQSFDRTFSQGSSDEDTVLSKKADPNVILNLAEQRVQNLLDTYSADKTASQSNLCPPFAMHAPDCLINPWHG